MSTVNMYPTKITQPNQNENSGLAGVHFEEIRRDGKIHLSNLRDLDDPKYFHAWKNTSNLKEGKIANCGNPSSYHCSHATYYGIKGYRNTCPIAGVTGTYTQPAALKLEFDPLKKGISSDAKIESVTLHFKHRCVGVDVENDKTSISWGPNFSGFKHYPNKKVVKVKFAGQTKEWNTNPPLSLTKYDTVSLKFKSSSKNKIDFDDLNKGSMVIQYGNNLSTDPGNIYIKDLKVEVQYTQGKIYIEGSQTKKNLYISKESSCRSSMTCYIEAGYKIDGIKVPPKKAIKKFQHNILTTSIPNNVNISTPYFPSNDGKTIAFDVTDESNTEGKKTIKCHLEDVGNISFTYTAVKRNKPTIKIPSSIEKNTKSDSVVSIKATNGCTSKIIAYDGDTSHEIRTFNNFINDDSNMISQNDVSLFYTDLANLSCGYHTIFFKRGDESNKEMTSSVINVLPANYKLKFYEITEATPGDDNSEILSKTELFSEIRLRENHDTNKRILIEYVKTKELINNPVFSIINPTYGLNGEKINKDPISFTPDKNGGSIRITIGRYTPGNYVLSVTEPENCSAKKTNLNISILPLHKQHFSEIFVRGEDSTSFDYDYLVALEGDTVQKPLEVSTITLGASYKDIKICTANNFNSTINKPDVIPVKVTNTSNKDIDNLFLELNALYENEDGDLEVSTDEWINEDGLFYNFTQKFSEYNKDISTIVDIKNLSPDDDNVDEEDVFIHIKKIGANQTITLGIPILSYLEKEIKLQILLFEEPMALYSIEDCTNAQNIFEYININVFDSILTDMRISGNNDILTPTKECPLECFNINGITYSIKNIDSSDAEYTETIIKNDPRLIPYKVEDKEGNEIDFNNSPKIKYESGIREREINIIGTKVINTIDFGEDYPEKIKLKGYTNSKGEVTFYITIPQSIGLTYTTESLSRLCDINIDAPNSYYEITKDLIVYNPGQTVPFKIKVFSKENYYINQFIFYPDIYTAKTEDHVTIYYKACNLKNNEGILKTSFETAPQNYKLIQNKVEEDILCGVPTSLLVTPKLEKVVVEQMEYNRLHLTVKNKNRFNKDIKIQINELENIPKYEYVSHNIETGSLEFNNNNIVWNIDYLDKNTQIKGYIDFKGKVLGLSTIKIINEDFASDIDFNVIQCDCRKEWDKTNNKIYNYTEE